MSFDWMAIIDMAGDVSSTNKANEYGDSFSVATDPAGWLYQQGYLGETPADRREREEKDREYRLRERQVKKNEAETRARLEQYMRRKRWVNKFSKAMYTGASR